MKGRGDKLRNLRGGEGREKKGCRNGRRVREAKGGEVE